MASVRGQNFLLFGFCTVQIGVLGVDVLLQFAANAAGDGVGRVIDACILSAVNYGGPDGWSDVSGCLTVPTDGCV